MQGLMQEAELTLDRLLTYASEWHGNTPIVSRAADGSICRTDYAGIALRAHRVSNALRAAGIGKGDRVATLGWNGYQHFEAWYGIIGIGAICHTLNPRLLNEQIAYLVNHAGDRIILADQACRDILVEILPQCPTVECVIFLDEETPSPLGNGDIPATGYETWISSQPEQGNWGAFDERQAAGLCYTSGTTGNPKGVLYSHRSNYLHAMMVLGPDALNLSARDTVLLAVPMYHANAWGVVYAAPMVGAGLVLPGQKLDGASLHELIETEGVTYSAGVPTIWQMLLTHLRDTGGTFSTLQRVTVGGSACPETIIREFRDVHGVDVIQGWGMTETSPLATVSIPNRRISALSPEEQVAYKLKQGRPLSGIELKLVDDTGQQLPHDGRTPGRLLIRGPTIASGYFGTDSTSLDEEGYFDTGDIATLDHDGYMQITDRAKDVIKSGGEWISSVDVENIAMGHPAAEVCAVIGIPHPKWDERPLLLVRLRKNASASAEEIRDYLKGRIASWWIPDRVEFVDDLPTGPTGKIDKKKLRDLYGGLTFIQSPEDKATAKRSGADQA
ncbi:MAG: long-chain fatty acid--CoA ligase [Alphaproteobacteria bacterium HGW-Alphaproteobacteria-18]|nr:MAG: long-chain fatty acid--CoA ligase [Alphaproteobacteria bacterium HGW-Alphaproteobacteria-18]